MAASEAIKRVVVGIDGSKHAAQALEWTIQFARPLQAEIIAVFAIPPPSFLEYGAGLGAPILPPELDPEWRNEIKREFELDWCRPLHDSGLTYRTVMEDGRPASVIAAVADREEAGLVVVGRRGHGTVAELLLGSVSHELSQHCKRPVVLISQFASAEKQEPALVTAAKS